jgi:hypothetical protein
MRSTARSRDHVHDRRADDLLGGAHRGDPRGRPAGLEGAPRRPRPPLIAPSDELSAGIDTGIRFGTPDARAAHEALRGRGLEVDALLEWETTPLMFSFLDHDANRYSVTEVS